MGNYNSGRWHWHDKKTTVEDCLTLDVFSLNRDKLLGWDRHELGSLTWRNVATGEETHSIGYQLNTIDHDCPWLRVFYTTTNRWTGDKAESDYKIRLQTTQPHYCGWRWWFTCPLADCYRRVGKLYLPSGGLYFGCRHCYDLTYRSCQESDKRVLALKRAMLCWPAMGNAAPILRCETCGERWRGWGRECPAGCNVGAGDDGHRTE